MRDYLYVWHDAAARCIVASGLEFRDFVPLLSQGGGVILLEHQAEAAEFDARSSFEYVPRNGLESLAAENIHPWGNLAWADYRTPEMPELSDKDVMHLLFVAHRWRAIEMPSILQATGGRFVACGHDDGWSLTLWYAEPSDVADLLVSVIPPAWSKPDFESFWTGASAYWLDAGGLDVEERSYDIDRVLNRRHWKRKNDSGSH